MRFVKKPIWRKSSRSVTGEADSRRVGIRILDHPGPVEREYGDMFYLRVELENLGGDNLDSERPSKPDYLSYHWETATGQALDHEGLRTPLPSAVPPGGSLILPMRVSVTVGPGEAVLRASVVREGEAWFPARETSRSRLAYQIAAGADESRLREEVKQVTGGGVKTRAETVEGFWGLRASVRDTGEGWGWLDHPAVLEECVFPKLGGGERNWLMAVLERHGVPRSGSWLSLGCGDGSFERWLAASGVADNIVGVDISPRAVEIAAAAARDAGLDNVTFGVLDLDRESLASGPYDVIFTSMSLHHLFELEHALESVHGALRPGGFFLANEYVGPSRFQFPARQKELAELVITLLPKELRLHPVASREAGRVVYKDKYLSRTPEQWEEIDPSEAVRSAEIIPIFEKRFESSWVYPYGGSLLHPVLEHIAINFDPADESDRAIIRLLDLLETELIKAGRLQNDFAVLVGRR